MARIQGHSRFAPYGERAAPTPGPSRSIKGTSLETVDRTKAFPAGGSLAPNASLPFRANGKRLKLKLASVAWDQGGGRRLAGTGTYCTVGTALLYSTVVYSTVGAVLDMDSACICWSLHCTQVCTTLA